MQIVILVVIMLVVGLIMGWIGGLIWKDKRPIGVTVDYIVAVINAVAVGLLDWFVIPAMGFSDTMKYLGVALEPALSVLLVLWVIRLARR
jgi:uncharacterized membrane protein YeaQ/YmgE (transglycosylase-associated protein family)